MSNYNNEKRKVVFIDRDGIINKDVHYLYKISDFMFSKGIFDLCKHLLALGYSLIVVTNQSGISRGYYKKDDFYRLTDWMLEKFIEKDIEILDVFFCPHGPDSDCSCRKPKPGMIIDASNKYSVDLNKSWMIGDREIDIKAANSAGINNTILISLKGLNKTKSNAKHTLDSIKQIKTVIIQ